MHKTSVIFISGCSKSSNGALFRRGKSRAREKTKTWLLSLCFHKLLLLLWRKVVYSRDQKKRTKCSLCKTFESDPTYSQLSCFLSRSYSKRAFKWTEILLPFLVLNWNKPFKISLFPRLIEMDAFLLHLVVFRLLLRWRKSLKKKGLKWFHQRKITQ